MRKGRKRKNEDTERWTQDKYENNTQINILCVFFFCCFFSKWFASITFYMKPEKFFFEKKNMYMQDHHHPYALSLFCIQFSHVQYSEMCARWWGISIWWYNLWQIFNIFLFLSLCLSFYIVASSSAQLTTTYLRLLRCEIFTKKIAKKNMPMNEQI